MSDKMIENNQVTIMGEIVSPFLFSHEVFGEGFYMVEVDVKRLSNSKDRIPLMISERLIDVSKDYTGEFIMVNGQFRSYNRHEEMKNRLILSVFVRELFFIEEELDGAKTNQILLDGYICKQPVYSKNTAGKGNRRSVAGSEQTVREIRLHSMYLLGKECQIRFCI